MTLGGQSIYFVDDHQTRPYDMVTHGVVKTNWYRKMKMEAAFGGLCGCGRGVGGRE